jgi:small subunit ribosomal protein S4e
MSKHLKRLAVPTSWSITKKTSKYVTRPYPTRSSDMSMPITVILRDLLKIAKTTKEVKGIINHSYVFINGTRVVDCKQVVGFMDILEIKGEETTYRMLLDSHGKLYMHTIKGEEAKIRPSKIIGKTIIKGKKTQINLIDGYNLLVEDSDLKVGDSVILEVPGNKIKSKVALEIGATVYMMGGSHVGKIGIVSELEESKIAFKVGNDILRTAKRHAFAIGTDKPMISVGHK